MSKKMGFIWGLLLGTTIYLVLFFTMLYAQTLPTSQMLNDGAKTVIAWDWTRGSGYNAAGFRIYCGDYYNNSADGTIGYYTQVQEVPTNTARSYLIWPNIQELAKMEGKAMPPYNLALRVRCLVVAYNVNGESSDNVKGVPYPPKNIRFVYP